MTTTTKLSSTQTAALLSLAFKLGHEGHGSTRLSLLRRGLVTGLQGDLTAEGRDAVEVILDSIRPEVTKIVRHLVHCTLENLSEAMGETHFDLCAGSVAERVLWDVEFHCETLNEYGLSEIVAPLGITDRWDVAKLGEQITCKHGLVRSIAKRVVEEVLSMTTDQVASEYRGSVRRAMDRYHEESALFAVANRLDANIIDLARTVVNGGETAYMIKQVTHAVAWLEQQGRQHEADCLDDARAAAMRGEGAYYVAKLLTSKSLPVASDDERRHHGWVLWVLWEAIEELPAKADMEREGWLAAAHDNENGGGERPTIDSSPYASTEPVCGCGSDGAVVTLQDGYASGHLACRACATEYRLDV